VLTPEISILKHILGYDNWLLSNDKLSIEDFPKELQPLYSAISNHHSANSNPNGVLTSSDLSNLVFSVPVKDKDFTLELIKQVDQCDSTKSTVLQLINSLHTRRLLKEISLTSYEIAEGRKDANSLTALLSSYRGDGESKDGDSENDFLVNDLGAVINKVVKTPGLRWRLNTLNQMLGSLRKGNLLVVFARPETGKTTFLASEVTHMAEQLTEDAGPILWFNNEQQGEDVLLRMYQASLGQDLPSLLSNVSAAQQRYLELTKDKLKLIDRSQLHWKYIEQLCKKYKPSLVVIDQFPAIQGFDADRKDLQLGAIARWTRELAKEYCPVIDVCQADGTGEGVKWLNMGHVADAKTAIQAHADAILGIGKSNEMGFDNIRYLHLSKNKLLGDEDSNPTLRHGKKEVLIEATIARYKDI